jgi:CheY-like chemotaxis protein
VRRLHRALRAVEQESADRIRIEQRLRAGEERFRIASGALSAIVYECDRASDAVERSDGLERLVGYRSDEVPGNRKWWGEQVHPDDLARIDPAGGSAAVALRAPGRRVLVVDDNADAADSLRMTLELMGHFVCVAYDGRAGLETGLAGHFDVALLDIGLPGLDGYALAGRLREALGERCPKLVALTGWGQADDRRRAEQAGFDVHLTKPADPAVIVGILRQCRQIAAA